jgi:hypothetical protein
MHACTHLIIVFYCITLIDISGPYELLLFLYPVFYIQSINIIQPQAAILVEVLMMLENTYLKSFQYAKCGVLTSLRSCCGCHDLIPSRACMIVSALCCVVLAVGPVASLSGGENNFHREF